MPWECTVYFRQPGNTPLSQPPGCAKSYAGRGVTKKQAVRAANARVPRGCQGKGIGSYGHPNQRFVP